MGTCSIQIVINKQGKTKLKQFCKWDGMPEGQGIDILTYLRKGDLKKFQKELDKIPQITNEQCKKIDEELGNKWPEKYHYLSNECGAKIYQMIEDDEVEAVYFENKTEYYTYIIDFSKDVFITMLGDEKTEFSLHNLPKKKKYLKHFNTE